MNFMRKSWMLVFGLLCSCGQGKHHEEVRKVDSSSDKIVASQEKADSTILEHEKYMTFNETIDTIPQELKGFIPKYYSAISMSSGDINADRIIDKVLVIRKNDEETSSRYQEGKPSKRRLLILTGQKDGTFRVALSNDETILCIDCNMVHDPFGGITIKDGALLLEHWIAGGPQHWNHTCTFKFDIASQRWLLSRFHFTNQKLNESDDPDAEALVVDTDLVKTQKDFGLISLDTFSMAKFERQYLY